MQTLSPETNGKKALNFTLYTILIIVILGTASFFVLNKTKKTETNNENIQKVFQSSPDNPMTQDQVEEAMNNFQNQTTTPVTQEEMQKSLEAFSQKTSPDSLSQEEMQKSLEAFSSN